MVRFEVITIVVEDELMSAIPSPIHPLKEYPSLGTAEISALEPWAKEPSPRREPLFDEAKLSE